ncbi:MAG TPA: cardiolipin synthase [Candidatus Competibacter sp.]|nr:cardiolipin synthase [Candidatus Competibacteraceae bacterium]HRW65151.1 cardiolipin synthase [Candidatus Competibacter sp.]
MADHLIALFSLAWLLWIALVAVGLILERRSPAATLAWLLALLFMPYFGFLVYLLFGPRRLHRRRRRYGRARERLIQSTRDLRPDQAIPPHFPDAGLERQLALLLERVGQGAPAPAMAVTLLETGDVCFEAIAASIAAATHHIHLEYYLWTPDRIGTRLRDLLADQARAGVRVRLLLDAIGSDRANRRFLQPLRDAGVQVAWFNPIGPRRLRLRYVNFRTHRKIVVCDGQVGFTGGINVSDAHSHIQRGPDAWRDLHLRIEGEPVHRLQFIFLEDWYFATGQEPLEPEFFPHFAEAAGPWLQVVESGPDNDRHAIAKLYFAAIAGAQRQILLATPYFVPNEALTAALITAALRGAEVRVLVPKRSDSRLVSTAARSYYDELVSAGITIHEYGPPMLHAKLLVVDERIAVVGSANFDNRSLALNFEAMAVLYDADLAEQLACGFAADLRHANRYVKPGRRATLGQRLGESTARLLSPLL